EGGGRGRGERGGGGHGGRRNARDVRAGQGTPSRRARRPERGPATVRAALRRAGSRRSRRGGRHRRRRPDGGDPPAARQGAHVGRVLGDGDAQAPRPRGRPFAVGRGLSQQPRMISAPMTIPTASAVAATRPISPHDVGAAAGGTAGSDGRLPGSESIPDRGGSDGAMSVSADGRVGASSNQRSASADAGDGGSGGGVF